GFKDRFVGVQLDGEVDRSDKPFDRFLRGQRLLHQIERLASAGRIVRDLRSYIDIIKRRFALGKLRHRWRDKLPRRRCRGWLARERRITATGPADTAFDQIMKAGITPGAMVVAPGCVKHAALAVRADPCPRLALV